MNKHAQRFAVLAALPVLMAAATAFTQGSAFTLYIANSLNYGTINDRFFTIETFNAQGNASVFATNSSFSNPILSSPEAVAISPTGQVYVDCTQDGTWIEQFNSSGNKSG
jgi:hypothetical protein